MNAGVVVAAAITPISQTIDTRSNDPPPPNNNSLMYARMMCINHVGRSRIIQELLENRIVFAVKIHSGTITL
jgi:hypothetical protein